MRNIKKIIAIMLAAGFCITSIPSAAIASENTDTNPDLYETEYSEKEYQGETEEEYQGEFQSDDDEMNEIDQNAEENLREGENSETVFYYDDSDVHVTATLDEAVRLPADAELVMVQVFPESEDEEKRAAYSGAESLLNQYLNEEEQFAVNPVYYDLYFEVDGSRISLEKPVHINIEYKNHKDIDPDANQFNVWVFRMDDSLEPEAMKLKAVPADLNVSESGAIIRAEFDVESYRYTPLIICMLESREAHEARVAAEDGDGPGTEDDLDTENEFGGEEAAGGQNDGLIENEAGGDTGDVTGGDETGAGGNVIYTDDENDGDEPGAVEDDSYNENELIGDENEPGAEGTGAVENDVYTGDEAVGNENEAGEDGVYTGDENSDYENGAGEDDVYAGDENSDYENGAGEDGVYTGDENNGDESDDDTEDTSSDKKMIYMEDNEHPADETDADTNIESTADDVTDNVDVTDQEYQEEGQEENIEEGQEEGQEETIEEYQDEGQVDGQEGDPEEGQEENIEEGQEEGQEETIEEGQEEDQTENQEEGQEEGQGTKKFITDQDDITESEVGTEDGEKIEESEAEEAEKTDDKKDEAADKDETESETKAKDEAEADGDAEKTEPESKAETADEVKEEEKTEEVEEAPPTRTYYASLKGDVSATVILTDPAQVPDSAEIVVTAVTPDAADYNYDAYIEALNNNSDSTIIYTPENTLLYDISFIDHVYDEEGELIDTVTYEPAEGTVKVILRFNGNQLSNEIKAENSEDVTVNHLVTDAEAHTTAISADEITVDPVDANVNLAGVDSVSFSTESFSVYAFTYTVDFHYEVNGKLYEFSIPGGGFVSLEHIVELLGVTRTGENGNSEDRNTAYENEYVPENEVYNGEDEAVVEEIDANEGFHEECINLNLVEVSEETKKFVADVENVEFSSPELVWVGKTDSANTIGGLKEANGLEIEYSADLTEEQIAEINAQTVEAGDWVLISVLPFTSEESLTITMKNGDQFTIRVTDAQKPYKDVSTLENGTYIIYNSFNSGANLSFLKNDGTSKVITPENGEALNAGDLSSYTWTVTKNDNGTFTIKSTRENRYINLYGDKNSYEKWSNNSYAQVGLSGNNGISISHNNKVLKRASNNDSNFGKFYNSTGTGVGLTFYKIENNPSSVSPSASGIELTDAERAEMEKWKEALAKFNTLTDYNKTAEVFNEDNRIYQIDITADSGITDFYKNVDLGLVLDVSNSMKFPSSLKALEDNQGNEQQVWMTADWLDWAKNAYSAYYNQDGCFYIISDPALTSTIYKVWKDGNQWKYQDASENPGVKVYNVNNGTVFKEPYRQAYTLYYADDKTKRMTYLQNSVTFAIDTLKNIVKPTEYVDDNTATIQVAYNFFAGISSNNGDNYAIRKSQDFVNLRNAGSELFSVSPAGNEASGTRQDLALYDTNSDPKLAANEFGWHSGYDKYVILVTDGAPNGASMADVISAANKLKNEDKVKIITVGLSTKDVDGGSQMLKSIADDINGDGIPEFYEAEKAKDLEYILLRILQSIMAKGIVRGTITDTIDSAFYPVDAQGNPLSAGVYNSSGKIANARISDYVSNGKPRSSHANEAFYTWEQIGDEWKVTWYNQEIGWNDNDSTTGNPWTGSVYVKAKEDYLGGNLLETNDGNAQIEPTGIKLVIDGTPELNWRSLEGMTPIDLPVPRVNVHNLETRENSTTWTVYKGTSVAPGDQIKALWNAIPIEEVVSSTKDNMHKITTGSGANVGSAGTGETFTVGSLMSEVAPDFNIDSLINQISADKPSVSQEFTYTAYGHESGKIIVKVERTVGNQTPAIHNADTVGAPAEQYKVTFTYQPYTEAERMNGKVKDPTETDHHNGPNGRGTEETGSIKSENTHTINVFQKGIKLTKVDKTDTNQVLPGAVFELFRVDAAGQADVSSYNLPEETYSKVGGDLTADANGIVTIDPVIPDQDVNVTDKTLYAPNHDTVFYLVEKTAPQKDGVTYAKMPGAIRFTLSLNENKGNDSTVSLYDWTQSADITAQEYENGTTTYLISDGNDNDVYAYRLINSTYGGLKIKKQVTYNHKTPSTSEQKSKLAGTYTFTIYTDEDCTVPYLEDNQEKTLTVVIGEDGISKESQEATLPPGTYWIKENEPDNDSYPLQEKISVPVEADKTGEHAAIASFTNNINECEDEAMITVRKTFSGIAESEIPAEFSVRVTNGTDTYVLTNDPEDANITWQKSEDGLVWTWKIYGITPGTTYTVSEYGENVSGYSVTTTGTGNSQTITPAQMTFNIDIETTCSHNDWPVSENTLFAASTTNKTGGKGTLIITKNRLSLSERKAVEEILRPMLANLDSNVWKTPVRYYSVEDNPTGFTINAGIVTYNVEDEKVILSDTDIWQHVASVSFTKTDPASADFNVTNKYNKKEIDISLVKVDVNHLNDADPEKLPGATFTIEKYISLNPEEKDTEWGTDGSVTIADTENTGTFSFSRLTAGYYKIIEDVFPSGYVQTGDMPVIEVRTNAESGDLEVYLLQKGEGNTYVDAPDNNSGTVKISNKTITVGNAPGVALPNTGGSGTTLLYLLGSILILGGGTFLGFRGYKRRKGSRN